MKNHSQNDKRAAENGNSTLNTHSTFNECDIENRYGAVCACAVYVGALGIKRSKIEHKETLLLLVSFVHIEFEFNSPSAIVTCVIYLLTFFL